jgi:hypothetical protein
MEALFGPEGEGEIREITEGFIRNWLTSFHREVDLRAQHEELASRDFACTFLAAVIGADCAVFAQIGDGAIVVPSHEELEEYCWVFWPQRGEYANETYFATDAAAQEMIQYDLVTRQIDELAVLTDGIQSIALHYESQTAHNRFFQPVFAWLRPAPDDYTAKFTASLAGYLNSAKVNESSNDDKTLVLATRRQTELAHLSHEQGDATATLQ